MKTNYIDTKLFVCLIGLVSCCFFSCRDEWIVPGSSQEEYNQLTIQVNLPGLTLPGTRSGMDEDEISTLDLLVFEKQPDGTELYAYHTQAQATGNENAQLRTFTVSLQPCEGQESYRLVLMGNLRTEIEAATLVKGETKEETLQKITFANHTAWDTDTPRYLPMWGESRQTHTVTTLLTGADIGIIYLLRAVARLDIGVNMSGENDLPQGLSEGSFLIREVKLHQVTGKGYAAPLSTAFNPSGGSSGEGIVTGPSTTGSPVTLSYQKTTPGHGFFKEIYLTETAAGPIGIPTTYTLLVSALYTPPGGTPATRPGWYKIHLYDERNQDPHSHVWPILRNHRYRVNITGVRQQGYASEAEALAAEATNLTVQLSVFEEDGFINSITYNGQYYLGTSTSQITVPGYGDAGGVFKPGAGITESIYIKSNFHSSWNCTFSDSPERNEGNPVDWVRYQSGNWSGPDQKDKIQFHIEPNLTGRDRSGYIHITAGLLHLTIKVNQAKIRTAELPNSYIMTPGGIVYVPVLKAYLVWADEIMGDQQQMLSGTLEAELIWQDTDNLLTTVYLPPDLSGPESVIRLYANDDGRMGNALVGIKIDGVLRYSWHIWVTDYNPDTHFNGTTHVYHNGYQSYRFMDRNLGALTATPGELTTHGFTYQWGRKDPFPGANKIVQDELLTTHKPLYVGTSGTASTDAVTFTEVTATNNLPNTFINPLVYYTPNLVYTGYDWYSADNIHNEHLWSDEKGGKGLFDPCPEGWRVPDWIRDNVTMEPLHSPWEGWTISNFPWNPAGYGNTYLDGSFYPAAGQRVYTGKLGGVGEYGNYWSATFSHHTRGYDIYILNMSDHLIVTDAHSPGSRPANGLFVRCVKE